MLILDFFRFYFCFVFFLFFFGPHSWHMEVLWNNAGYLTLFPTAGNLFLVFLKS